MKKKLIFLITYIILTGCIAKSGAKLYEETPKPEVSAVTEKTPEATDGAVDDLLVEADEADKEAYQKYFETDHLDLDLTFMSSTAIYSEVFNMTQTPEEYDGKMIRLSGLFMRTADDKGNPILGVIIPDATACCSQGIEIRLKTDLVLPKEGTPVTVEGIFSHEQLEYYVNLVLEEADLWTFEG